MLIKHTILLLAALLTGYLISPSYSGDIISCDSFENCPDGSEPLTNQLIQLENKIDALEELLAGVSRGVDPNTSQDTLTFSNMNVQVVNGSGYTSGTTTGTGNLIIGYNELRGSEDVRIGSHMLVLGDTNNYSGFGGVQGRQPKKIHGFKPIPDDDGELQAAMRDVDFVVYGLKCKTGLPRPVDGFTLVATRKGEQIWIRKR